MGFSNIIKSILFGFCFVFGQIKTGYCQPSADSISQLFPQLTNCFHDYRSGPDESFSIGLLNSIFNINSNKNEFLIRNPELLQLEVTGTAAPFDRFVPFNQWLHYMDSSSLNGITVWYDLENRQDGMIIESLYFSVTPSDPCTSLYKSIVRTITIYRMDKTIISIMDSDLN